MTKGTDHEVRIVHGSRGSWLEQAYEGAADSSRKGCYDCGHLKGAVSWWCTSKEASSARGTTIPGVVGCPFWAAPPVVEEKKKPWWRVL